MRYAWALGALLAKPSHYQPCDALAFSIKHQAPAQPSQSELQGYRYLT